MSRYALIGAVVVAVVALACFIWISLSSTILEPGRPGNSQPAATQDTAGIVSQRQAAPAARAIQSGESPAGVGITAMLGLLSEQVSAIENLPLNERYRAFQQLMLRWRSSPAFEHEALAILTAGVNFPIIGPPTQPYGPQWAGSMRLGLLGALDGRLSEDGGLLLKEIVLRMDRLDELAFGIRVIDAWNDDVARDLAVQLAEDYDPREPFKIAPGLDMTFPDFSRELLARFGSLELLEFVRNASPNERSYRDIAALWSLPEPLRQEETLRRLGANATHSEQVDLVASVNHMDISSPAVQDAVVALYGTAKYDATKLALLWDLGHAQSVEYPYSFFHPRPRERWKGTAFPEWLALQEQQLAARRQVLDALHPLLKSPQEHAGLADSKKGLDEQKAALESSAKAWRASGNQ